jgi:hypothetical protein
MGHAGDGPQACLITPPAGANCTLYDDPRHKGCGSRGGPGCRKENGRCAAWHEHFVPDCRMQSRHSAVPPA